MRPKAGLTLAQVTSCLPSGYFKSRPILCRDLSLSCNSCPWQEGFPDTMGRALPLSPFYVSALFKKMKCHLWSQPQRVHLEGLEVPLLSSWALRVLTELPLACPGWGAKALPPLGPPGG